MLNACIDANLANGFIQQSSSPILLAKKNDGGLRLCVNYHALNKLMMKNLYPILCIWELIDCVHEARLCMKLDFRSAYNHIRNKKGNEYKTVFWILSGLFNYQVMPFGLTITPATFQFHLNDFLRPYTHDFTVCYTDNILFYLANKYQHEEHVRQLLQRVLQIGHYCKAERCQFGVSDVSWLGVCYHSRWSRHGIGADLHNWGLANTGWS